MLENSDTHPKNCTPSLAGLPEEEGWACEVAQFDSDLALLLEDDQQQQQQRHHHRHHQPQTIGDAVDDATHAASSAGSIESQISAARSQWQWEPVLEPVVAAPSSSHLADLSNEGESRAGRGGGAAAADCNHRPSRAPAPAAAAAKAATAVSPAENTASPLAAMAATAAALVTAAVDGGSDGKPTLGRLSAEEVRARKNEQQRRYRQRLQRERQGEQDNLAKAAAALAAAEHERAELQRMNRALLMQLLYKDGMASIIAAAAAGDENGDGSMAGGPSETPAGPVPGAAGEAMHLGGPPSLLPSPPPMDVLHSIPSIMAAFADHHLGSAGAAEPEIYADRAALPAMTLQLVEVVGQARAGQAQQAADVPDGSAEPDGSADDPVRIPDPTTGLNTLSLDFVPDFLWRRLLDPDNTFLR